MQWLDAFTQQAITWANVYRDLCRHMASLDHELMAIYELLFLLYFHAECFWWSCIDFQNNIHRVHEAGNGLTDKIDAENLEC